MRDNKRIYKLVPILSETSTETQEFILRVVSELKQRGKYNDIDCGALTILARDYDVLLRAHKELREQPLTIGTNKNPIIGIAAQVGASCLRIMQDFGLTAKSRKSLNKGDTQGDAPSTAIDEYID